MPVLIDATPEYTVTFTPVDVLSTDPNEMAYQIRTAASGGGTLLDSGICTNGVEVTTPTILDLLLTEGPNTRYVRTRDGANNWTDTAFVVLAEQVPPTPGEIDDALSGGSVAIFFTYEQRNADFGFVADLTTAVRRASIQCVNARQVVRTAIFDINQLALPDSFDPDTSLIAVNGTLRTVRGNQLFTLGLFRLDMSEEEFEPGSVLWPSVPGSDLSSVLQSKFDEPYQVEAGDLVMEAVREIIETESVNGITLKHNLAVEESTFPVQRVFDTKLTKLDIINDMLKSIHWYPLWPDEKGVFTSRLIVDPIDEEISIVYGTITEPRMVGMPFTRRRIKGLPNSVKVIIDDPRRTPEYAHVRNDDALSPVSTVNSMEHPIEINGALVTDVALAQDIARFTVLEATTRSFQGDLITDFDPRRKPHETYQLQLYDALRDVTIEDSTRYRALAWSVELREGAPMRHQVAKVQDPTLTVVV